MQKSLPTLLFRVVLLLALLTSAALYVHYLSPSQSGFCSGRSGCERVRLSDYAFIIKPWLSVPLVGVLAFTTVLAASLVPATRRLARALALVGGAFGIALVGLQAAVIGSFCWLCVVVDVCAVAAAPLAVWWSKSEGQDPLKTWAWGVLAGACIASPLLWTEVGAVVPAEIRALYRPGKINVVEFADFECPFCRRAHPVLKEIALSYGDEVFVKRLNMPLSHMHPFAHGAALAAICAGAQGKEAAMADQLFRLELNDSTATEAANTIGLDMPAFEHCIQGEKAETQLAEEMALVQRAGLEGLPTTYIGNARFIGARSEAEFRDAFELARRGASTNISGWLYIALWASFALVVVFFGRQRNEPMPA